MDIVRNAVAGTLESNDVLVSVTPGQGQLDITVQSIVLEQFGDAIRAAVEGACEDQGVTDAKVTIEDRGALDCTIRARVETALKRAGGTR